MVPCYKINTITYNNRVSYLSAMFIKFTIFSQSIRYGLVLVKQNHKYFKRTQFVLKMFRTPNQT